MEGILKQTEDPKNLHNGKNEDSKTEKQISEFQESEKESHFDPIQKLKSGFRYFMEHMYNPDVAEGQQPKFLIFACSDSRVCPSNVLTLHPGQAFVVRNIANLVPAFNQLRYSGVGATIEYAVEELKVKNILIIGHSRCGGIRGLMGLPKDGSTSNDFVDDWVKIGLPAKAKVLAEHPDLGFDEQCKICEKEAVNLSLVNIQSYPYVRKAMADRELTLWGGYYDFVCGGFQLWEVKYHVTDPIPL